MDELILTEIARQVYQVDHVYIDARIGTIEKATQWDGALYLNWRRYLLGKKIKEKKLLARVAGDRRDEYAKWRCAFLERKFDRSEHSHFPRSMSQTSLHSSASSNSLYSDHSTDESPPPSPHDPPQRERGRSQSLGASGKSSLPIPEFRKSPVPPTHAQQKSEPKLPTVHEHPRDVGDYSFSGMHHIFAETTHPITCLEFGWNDNDILAFGSQEGHVYLCSAMKSPRVLHILKGHVSPITGLRWTSTNDQLISSSTDSVRMWDRKTGLPVRTMKEVGMSCCLNPTNDNLVLISDNKGYIKVINLSTGKSVLRVKALANVTCMQFDSLGHYLFAGDEKGFVQVFKYTKDSGALQLLNKTAVSNAKPVTSLAFKGLYNNHQFAPSLLVNCKDNSVKIFTMKSAPPSGALVLTKEFHVQNKRDPVKGTWCPLVDSPCLVTGSEDSSISFFDMRKKDKPINTLMGHGGTVTAVSWAYDESLLASADANGMVILWTRKLNP